MTWSSTKELLLPFENSKRVLRSRTKLFKVPSLADSNSPEFDQISEIEEHIKEQEVTEIMAETMEQYMSKTRDKIRSGIARPTIDADIQFELKGQFLKELQDNTFSGLEHKDANEHIEKVLEIVDLFHVPKITQDQLMLLAFPVSLTGAVSRWLRNEPTGSITTREGLKTKFLNKYCPHARASVSVMPFSTYTNLGLGNLSHTRMTIELADRTIKQPKGIATNVLVRIGKFVFPIDFVILDIPEDDDVPLILERPFLSTTHVKIDFHKRKVTLRVEEEKIDFKSISLPLT
uniref:Reverse transcriptase domain-containing protein n=1 Tax=Tanacetum cinerariifolium TaxID=118510 RepID=A0A699HMA6_TANCI|nr:hypothetical protein [Tanacetum cinerariifolium]